MPCAPLAASLCLYDSPRRDGLADRLRIDQHLEVPAERLNVFLRLALYFHTPSGFALVLSRILVLKDERVLYSCKGASRRPAAPAFGMGFSIHCSQFTIQIAS
jgi:hypothetical protein